MRPDAFEPITLPDDVWSDPAMLAALRDRSISHLFTVALGNKAFGISQTRVANLVGMDQSEVSRIRTGRRKPMAIDLLERVADAFCMPNEARNALGLASKRAPATGATSQQGSSPVRPVAQRPAIPVAAPASSDLDRLVALTTPSQHGYPTGREGFHGSSRGLVASTPEEVFMAAAMETTAGLSTHSCSVGSDTMELLHSQLSLVAQQYAWQPPMIVFSQARQLLEAAERLSERTRRPGELADAYMAAGGATALMASIAFDLGEWTTAAHIAKAATSYADLADHRSLMAWSLGLQGTLAFWCDDLDTSFALLARGLECAPPGRHRFRLLYIAARAHALRDDAAATARVLAEAEEHRDGPTSDPDPLMDRIQGEFAFDDARAAACAGAAWLQLGDGEEAERYTSAALDSYLAERESTRPFSPLNGARIDTAAARLLRGELDGAQEALSPVFTLSASRRNTALVGRLETVQTMLTSPPWVGQREAQHMASAVASWLAENAAAPLPHA